MSEKLIPYYPENHEEDVTPFIIRGHHLDSFRDMLRGDIAPAEYASLQKRLFLNDRSKYQNKKTPSVKNPFIGINYIQDVVGHTEEEIEQNAQKVYQFYEQFFQLSDEHPVKIVLKQKDGICNACIVGEHCTLNNKYAGSITTNSDHLYLEVIYDELSQQNFSNENVILGKEEAVFSDTSPEVVPYLILPKGILKTILSQDTIDMKLSMKRFNWQAEEIYGNSK